MLVWLASYPRSGNHLLRTILQRCFDLGSYEIYQKTSHPVSSKWSALTGLRRFDEDTAEAFVANARSSPELFLIKTHDPVPDSDKCIYVVRDARAALVSYQRYLADVAGKPRSLADLFTGDEWPGKWQDHVKCFLSRDPRNTLVLRYEELASANPPLDRIGTFLGATPLRPFDVPFSSLHELSPQMFPTGHNGVGIEIIERQHQTAFWSSCGEVMRALGYPATAGEELNRKKIFFLHLPKCAGTSMWSALRGLAGSENVFQVWSAERRQQFAEMPAAQRNAYRVVGGHFPLDFYREHLDLSQYFCIATFREPVQRILSEYHYAARNPKHSDHALISQMSLAEFIEWMPNPITKLICGQADARDAVDTVREVFDRWAFVDELGQLVADLCLRTGEPLLAAPRLNVGPLAGRPAAIDAELLRLIRRHHDADLELHRLLVEARAAETPAGTALAASPIAASPPVFQVVTPSLNGARYLDETIESVVGQAGNFSIRYHIQDGGSRDGTLEIIRRWQRRIEARDFSLKCNGVRLTSDSRPDGGMYDAIAAGFRSLAPASDHLMTWINADDRLALGAMSIVAEVFRDLPQVELVGGRVALIDARGESFGAGPLISYPRKSVAAGLHDGRHLPFIMQEGTFWRAGLWHRTGGVDTRFRLAGDWDLWRRFAVTADYIALDAVTGYHRRHAGQLTADKAAYYREIDGHLAEETASRQEGLPDQKEPADLSSVCVARRAKTGRWVLFDWHSPTPMRDSLLPLDGDWVVVSGFDDPEGPFPEKGLETQYRWTTAQPATLDIFSSFAGRRTVLLEMSSMVRRQKVEVSLDHGAPVQRTLRRRFPKVQTVAIEHDFACGPCRLAISVDRWLGTAEGRKLGVILRAVRFEAERQRRWFAFSGFRSVRPFLQYEKIS